MTRKDKIIEAALLTTNARVKTAKVNLDALLDTCTSIPDHVDMAGDVYRLFEDLEKAQALHETVVDYASEHLSDESEMCYTVELDPSCCNFTEDDDSTDSEDLQEDGFV